MKKKKNKIIGSTAVIISLVFHFLIISIAGGIIALKFIKKQPSTFQIEEQKSIERRKLDLPVKTESFVNKISKPQIISSKNIASSTPDLLDIPNQGEFVKMAPLPTFQGSYTNFIKKDRRLTFNSKFREIDFGVSKMDFFGTKSSAEKVIILMDVSKKIVHDRMGGLEVYKLIYDDFSILINEIRSSTLVNLILFDNEKIVFFDDSFIAATTNNKTNMLNWVNSINTESWNIGLKSDYKTNYPKNDFVVPMKQEDITGWIKALQATLKFKPETYFILTSNWGNTTDPTMSNVSYFSKKSIMNKYLKERNDHIISKYESEYDERKIEFDNLKLIYEKMLDFENNARDLMLYDHKISHNWTDILSENNAEFPYWINVESPISIEIFPADTRYTYDEVLETIYTLIMKEYGHLGFPRINFILAEQRRPKFYNFSETAPLMTSRFKFIQLCRMIDARLRRINLPDPIKNEIDQNFNEIKKNIVSNEEI